MKEIKVGIIGFGTVGSGTAEILVKQADLLRQRTGLRITLARVADRSADSLPPEFDCCAFSNDADDVINDPDIDIVAELIGGLEPARDFVLRAIASGKHIVTANKALLSLHGSQIFQAAAAAGVEVGFEASVAGGIPVIKALKEGLAANRINVIMGILNGTANYILSRMTDEGLPFATVLADAQARGYAEADPSYDVDGIDTAHKLVILMAIAYGINISLADVIIEGISRIEPIDIAYAKQFGCRIKLLAISKNYGDHVEARVHPTMVPEEHMLASVNGAYNAVYFNGDMAGNVMLYGRGAGGLPTGSAVVADIIDTARNIAAGCPNRVPGLSFKRDDIVDCLITPMAQLTGAYYFRMSVHDEPGVLAEIAGILGENGISIESVIQKKRQESGPVPVVIRTHAAVEEAVNLALGEIDSRDFCTSKTVKIRILA
ncbi:MAG: homoserine dehydrogenase [Deltaproteobacteria bacterium]|nr:homoserine dehydrogenase [Deltaproteobacteria bacterium]